MKQELEDLIRLLAELQKIDAEFPLQYAVCLCEIARAEGLSLTQLSAKTGMPLSTVSRIVGALSKYRQKGKPYGLVKVTVAPTERRRKEISLTARGRSVIENLSKTLESFRTRPPS
ncbi:MAG: helix-turn-helix domain-containing protein [Alphaproteobacteria bacterium]|nr:helix-turn-helix domain-containing protein [Alphaproteobacteria bacterium]MBK9584328.1 helix-turn-helix domain-containing protein [Alphaproteobacteria bacterium]MBP7758876.1 helix-turn-helix domain-containing protein [Alphaproteobacteria bacterium]MBP7762050.1 helix-turn-helix domain-containing protein [Alphaproteobacteria bacterium]MBP7906142.1 helix-turn-helix domain-containing protein [Alphaproteobacteria bacterium]